MSDTLPLARDLGPLFDHLVGTSYRRPVEASAGSASGACAGASASIAPRSGIAARPAGDISVSDRIGAAAPGRDVLQNHIAAIARVQDRVAFAALFDHFAPRVKSYLMRLGAPANIAEDLAQETLLTVWRKAAYYDPAKAAASSWVFAIARNLRIDALRRERNPAAIDWALDAEPDPAPLQDATLDLAQQCDRLIEALRDLPPEQAEVVRLSYFSDKPHSEIERELGIPLGTVKSRMRLALARLRLIMDSTQ